MQPHNPGSADEDISKQVSSLKRYLLDENCVIDMINMAHMFNDVNNVLKQLVEQSPESKEGVDNLRKRVLELVNEKDDVALNELHQMSELSKNEFQMETLFVEIDDLRVPPEIRDEVIKQFGFNREPGDETL